MSQTRTADALITNSNYFTTPLSASVLSTGGPGSKNEGGVSKVTAVKAAARHVLYSVSKTLDLFICADNC